jgi:transcriptional regulator of arginine metabolism
MKAKRQAAILDLVNARDIFTQGELTQALAKAGFPAAQATISRDINELRLTKEPTEKGSKYVAPNVPGKDGRTLSRVFREGLTSMDYAGNMLVLNTRSGMAMAVAVALDGMKLPEILGTVAGDNVVMCVIRSEALAAALMEKFQA